MRIHLLKTWPEFYEAVLQGRKRFEVRKNDRGYAKGDYMLLEEWYPDKESYSGRTQLVGITSVYLLKEVLEGDDYVGMDIRPAEIHLVSWVTEY